MFPAMFLRAYSCCNVAMVQRLSGTSIATGCEIIRWGWYNGFQAHLSQGIAAVKF